MSAQGEPYDGLRLADYVRVLRRGWWLVVGGVVVGAAAAYALVAAAPPVYEARAELLVQPVVTGSGQLGRQAEVTLALATERDLVRSGEVAQRVRDRLDPPMSLDALLAGVSVSDVSGSQVFAVSFRHGDPEVARLAAQAFAESYLEHRSALAAERLRQAEVELEGSLRAVESELLEINEALVDAEPQSVERVVAESERQLALRRLSDLLAARAELRSSPAEVGAVVTPALVPTDPVEPRAPRYLAVGTLLGLFGGTVAAFVRRRLERRVGDPRDVEERLAVPVVASVESVAAGEDGLRGILGDRARRDTFERVVTTLPSPRVPRTATFVMAAAISATADDAAATAIELALAGSRLGRRVLLVPLGDTVTDDITQYLELPVVGSPVRARNGLTVHPLPSHPSFAVLTRRSGALGTDDVEPGTAATADVVRAVMARCEATAGSPLHRRYEPTVDESWDLVVLAAPPVLEAADGLLVAGNVDRVVLTIRRGRVRWRDLEQTLLQLSRARAPECSAIFLTPSRRAARSAVAAGDRTFTAVTAGRTPSGAVRDRPDLGPPVGVSVGSHSPNGDQRLRQAQEALDE